MMANFYRLRKSKLFRIILIAIITIVVGLSVTCYLDEEFFFMLGVNYDGAERHGFYIGHITQESSYMEYLRSSLGFIFFTCISLLFLVGDTVVSPFKNGMIKSSLSYGHSRSNLYIAQLVTNIVGAVIITGVTIVTAMGTIVLLFRPTHAITFAELYSIISICLVLLCIVSAMVSIYQLLFAIVKSKSVVTTVGALFIAVGTSIFFELSSEAVKGSIPSYMIMNVCGDPNRMYNNLILFVINSILILIVTSLVGCSIYRTLEIK